ncbi:hypothetical protein K466DRAFT_668084 [Polyporus arcularius HHB13444]|uniref:DUF6699 domain-containing protein n=1 Tax=Polyporus arcularius HHB13444 TaxID=1314778 RepID=A0A5C3NT29_9APHY|nr:hypothetical protein K466DRAFT_668084 [Polyporus arcularius HHB13444]
MPTHAKQQRYSAHGTTKFHAQYTITYYRLRPVVPDAPKRNPTSLPPDPYTRIHVPRRSSEPEQPPAYPNPRIPVPGKPREPQQPPARPRRHSNVHDEALKAKHRRVHWADEATFLNPEKPSAPKPPLAAPPPPPKPATLVKPRRPAAPVTSATPATPSRTAPPLPALHELLVSFPERLWDMRRRASPTFHPPYEPRYWEPVFPSSPYTAPKTLRLVFTPCPRTELSWFATVTPSGRGTHLVVGDVLRTISVELFRRGACRDLYTDHPCFAKANAARQLRAREGWSQRAYFEDGIRNVDLYHVERGFALWFRGLSPERLRSGEVVYRVRFSYA